jgi:uncharacterized protein YjbJ (UPF0337 family)
MNWSIIAGDWPQFEGHVKPKFALTDDSRVRVGGTRERLAGRRQELKAAQKLRDDDAPAMGS